MLASRVLPAFALVRASRMPVSALMSVDLPTFERPTSATCGTPSRGVSSPRAALVTNSAPATLMRNPFFRRVGNRLGRGLDGIGERAVGRDLQHFVHRRHQVLVQHFEDCLWAVGAVLLVVIWR